MLGPLTVSVMGSSSASYWRVSAWIRAPVPAVVWVLAVVLPLYLLFGGPMPTNYNNSDNGWLVAVRDVSIIYASLFMCIGAISFIAMTAAIASIAFLIRNRIAPALEKADDTMKTVRGTATTECLTPRHLT